uniref:Neb-colloostatin n=1 Tax=Sarcophaga bullata TaxID=7385 RepID=COOT_SARBU|nr:RecName: Full=Neb-colloostatin; AltName: Full=Folliculostatin [Sarcophaga bullata]AAB33693.1 Neb-colloostatin=collagen-related folliculostatin [Sarcophaga bullata]
SIVPLGLPVPIGPIVVGPR